MLMTFYQMKNKTKLFLIYDFAYKTPHGAKPFCIIFDKVDGYIRKYDSTRYLESFYPDEKYERIFHMIGYVIMLKCNISDVYPYKYMKIKIDSDDD